MAAVKPVTSVCHHPTHTGTSPRRVVNTRDTLCLQPPSLYTTGDLFLRSEQKVYNSAILKGHSGTTADCRLKAGTCPKAESKGSKDKNFTPQHLLSEATREAPTARTPVGDRPCDSREEEAVPARAGLAGYTEPKAGRSPVSPGRVACPVSRVPYPVSRVPRPSLPLSLPPLAASP